MTWLSDALEQLRRWSEAGLTAPAVKEIHGQPWLVTKDGAKQLVPNAAPKFPGVQVQSLRGLFTYLREIDELRSEGTPLFLHVVNANRVQVSGFHETDDHHATRTAFCVAEWKAPALQLDRFLPLSIAIPHIQTCFYPSKDWSLLLALISRVTDEEIEDVNDDGISQEVVTRGKTSLSDREGIKNPFLLHPYRTFPEVDESLDASPFVLRIQKGTAGPEVKLIEVGAGMWESEAMAAIENWLKAQIVPEEKITILA